MAPGQAKQPAETSQGFVVSVDYYYQVLVYEVYQAPARISEQEEIAL